MPLRLLVENEDKLCDSGRLFLVVSESLVGNRGDSLQSESVFGNLTVH